MKHNLNNWQNYPGRMGGPLAKLKTCGQAAHAPVKGWHSRGYLPHYDAGYGYQMITYRLADSLPQMALQAMLDKKITEKKKRIEIEKYLDSGYGSCVLAKPEIAQIVIENWNWFSGKRYELIAFVVMPNHVHLLIQIFEGVPLSQIVHGWKSYTAKEIKSYLLNAGEPPALPTGPPIIWQADYWDRYIRNEQHYFQAVEYIHNNPVKAGLCVKAENWRWSSAMRASRPRSRT